jgi:hypothetical protein
VSIKGQLREGNPQKASVLMAEALEFFPEHKGLAALNRELVEFPKGQEVKSLLAKAEQQLKSRDWTQPPGNNAFETLQKVLRLDPNNRQAQKLLASIPERCAKFARATQQQGNNATALPSVEECLRFFPRDVALMALRDELRRPVDIGSFEESAPEEVRNEESTKTKPRRRRGFGTF